MRKQSEKEIEIPINSIFLKGILNIPKKAKSMVIFAHGAGSSRLSPRNAYVARELNKAGIATLLFDLLTEEEDMIYENRFNVPLLTTRLIAVTKWVKTNPKTKTLAIGYFGASTGSAAALQAVAEIKGIKAVVSRGGRPDLVLPYLPKVSTPTLLIVGELDEPVIEMNKIAYERLKAEKELVIVPGATHLFEEPGKLEKVATLARKWFLRFLTS
ncbi:MAG: dienelactone hydrolase family protein [Candidatus Aenigmarchaeota archaeon]|nr:dienelactone hydrolase family protein [Candidatus Aenigmarchaeota archaeon]